MSLGDSRIERVCDRLNMLTVRVVVHSSLYLGCLEDLKTYCASTNVIAGMGVCVKIFTTCLRGSATYMWITHSVQCTRQYGNHHHDNPHPEVIYITSPHSKFTTICQVGGGYNLNDVEPAQFLPLLSLGA